MQLTVRDAALLLNLSEKTIYRWIKKQAIPAMRIGDQYRFNRTELLEWATARRLPLSPSMFQEEKIPGQPLRINLALKEGGIYYRVGGRDRAGVLQSVVDLLRLPEDLNRDWLFQVLLARELLGSTAIGNGIAIPHVRTPIVLQIPRPQITLCFLEEPVDFGSLDGQPVHTLFVLISPTIRAHLHLLSRLAHILHHADLRQALATQGSREEILAQVEDAERSIRDSDTQDPETRPA